MTPPFFSGKSLFEKHGILRRRTLHPNAAIVLPLLSVAEAYILLTPNPLILEKWSCLQQTDRKTAIVHLLATDAKSQWVECRPNWPFPSSTMLVLATEIRRLSWMTRENRDGVFKNHTFSFLILN